MTQVKRNEQVKKVFGDTEEQAVISTTEASEPVADPLAELLGRAERAYAAFLEAQREVARAYKGQEKQAEAAYRKAEQRANEACEAAMEQVLKARLQAEQGAEEAYRRARDEAAAVYQESVRQVLRDRKETMEQAWETSKQAVEQSWKIFQGNRAKG